MKPLKTVSGFIACLAFACLTALSIDGKLSLVIQPIYSHYVLNVVGYSLTINGGQFAAFKQPQTPLQVCFNEAITDTDFCECETKFSAAPINSPYCK